MIFDLLLRILVALAIGGLVGLEREIYQQKQQKKRRGFAGIRTYLVVAFLGAVAALMLQMEEWKVFAYLMFGGITLLVVAAYVISGVKGYTGMTTELSVLLVFVLAMLATVPEYQKIAVILGVILAVVLSLKEHLHKFARTTKKIEWFDALTFVFMAFVILPLLPNENYTVLGIVDAFNPYRTWLMVVFVSGVSFVGYFLSKLIGGTYGIGLAGLLGGVVSSTAVTESMATDSKKNPLLVKSYAFGAIIASVVMGVRVYFEVWVIDSSMLSVASMPLFVMSVIGIISAILLLGKEETKSRHVDLKLGSPLTLRPAIIFGLLYSLVVFITHAMLMYDVSSSGFVALGLIAGLVDVDAITLTMTSVYSNGGVTEIVAWVAIIAAVISNTFFKILTAKLFGSTSYFLRVGGALFVVALAGIITVAIFLL